LKHQSPIQALQKWRSEKPELFVKRVDKQPGLDSQAGRVMVRHSGSSAWQSSAPQRTENAHQRRLLKATC